MITVKTPEEIVRMRRSGAVTAALLQMLEKEIRPGISTGALDRMAEVFIRQHGGTPSFKNYNGFPASICTSVNEQVVHGIPGHRHLKEGDIVGIDVGVILDGFHSDAARTFAVGSVAPEVERLMNVTKQCFFEGMRYAREGCRVQDISAAVQACAEDAGFSVVRELCGHGVGRELHEDPEVPNFGRAGRGPRLMKGFTLAVEPMINLGKKEVFELDDGWTVVTADGKASAHYENTIVITDGEPEILTLR